mmetsp:Transcript_34715/g.75878  ORF Transcript_34715/g.75878 Transcript_34715/m.75878 type:complete len:216 (+) Transcript_34715:62-709(+)
MSCVPPPPSCTTMSSWRRWCSTSGTSRCGRRRRATTALAHARSKLTGSATTWTRTSCATTSSSSASAWASASSAASSSPTRSALPLSSPRRSSTARTNAASFWRAWRTPSWTWWTGARRRYRTRQRPPPRARRRRRGRRQKTWIRTCRFLTIPRRWSSRCARWGAPLPSPLALRSEHQKAARLLLLLAPRRPCLRELIPCRESIDRHQRAPILNK